MACLGAVPGIAGQRAGYHAHLARRASGAQRCHLSDEALLKYGTLAKMNPPLRSEADRKATIEAIADGTVDLLATDHAPHTLDEKRLGFLEAPNGIIGLECAYGVCHKGLVDGGFISDKRLIELMSTEPMKLMGHAPTDITALLDAQQDGTGEGNRVLDLRTIGDAEEIGAASHDYLFYSGYVALAYWWARSVATAKASAQDDAFKQAKLETARFYYARVLPRTLTHAACIQAGAAPLMAMQDARFGA